MVTYGEQTNDAIIQTALRKMLFDIDLADESLIDRITLSIRYTLIRDLPSDIHTNYKLQTVMLKTLMSTLLKSKPTVFGRDIHNFLLAINNKKSTTLKRSTLPSILNHVNS